MSALALALFAMFLLALLQFARPADILAPAPLGPFHARADLGAKAAFLLGNLALLAFFAFGVLGSEGAQRRFLWFLFILGAAVALLGIVQHAQDPSPDWVRMHGREQFLMYGIRKVRYGRLPFGPYYNRNHAGALMAMAFCAGAGIFRSRFASMPRRRGLGRLSDFLATQAIVLLLLALLSIGLAWCRSRGAILALASSCLLLAPFACSKRPGRKALLGAYLLLAALAAAILLGPKALALLQDKEGAGDPSVAWRLSIYASALRLWRDFPIFGIGWGAFGGVFPAYQERLVGGSLAHAHCDWLELAVEQGLIGLLLLLGALVRILWLTRSRWPLLDPERRWLCLGGWGAAACFFLHGFLDFNLHIPANAALFVCLMACLERLAGKDDVCLRNASTSPRPALGALAAALGLALWAVLAARPLAASIHSRKVLGARRERRLFYAERALAFERGPSSLYRAGWEHFSASRGSFLHKTRFLRAALAHAEEAARLNPLSPSARHLRAAALWELGRKQDAQELLREASLLRFR